MTARFGLRGANLASLLIVSASGAFMWVAAMFHTQTTALVILALAYCVSFALVYLFVLSAAGVTLRLRSRRAEE